MIFTEDQVEAAAIEVADWFGLWSGDGCWDPRPCGVIARFECPRYRDLWKSGDSEDRAAVLDRIQQIVHGAERARKMIGC